MNKRRTEILETAIELIADEGYASLSMRALARAVGMKLASLQYYFRSSDELLRAIVGHVSDAYSQAFDSLKSGDAPLDVREIVTFVMNDEPGSRLLGDRLWPQLWAMQQVEPLVSDLVENIYAQYFKILKQALQAANADAPHGEALLLMSMLEGSTIFAGEGRRWEKDAKALETAMRKYVEHRYGDTICKTPSKRA